MAMGQGTVNRVILIGNCGADPESNSLPSGDRVTNLSIATTQTWKDRNTGDRQSRTEWHRIVFFRQLAEIASSYLRKGSKVYIEGSLRTRSWEQDGVKRYTTEIVADQMQMLDRRDEASDSGFRGRGSAGPASEPQAGAQAGDSAPAAAAAGTGQAADDFDDDIPF